VQSVQPKRYNKGVTTSIVANRKTTVEKRSFIMMELQAHMEELIIPSLHAHCQEAANNSTTVDILFEAPRYIYRQLLEDLWVEAMDESNEEYLEDMMKGCVTSKTDDQLFEEIREVVLKRASTTNKMDGFYINKYYTVDFCSEEQLLQFYS
jgi:hypothetical protein